MYKRRRETRAPAEKPEQRPVGGHKMEWSTMQMDHQHATVSYEEMCDTIERRLQNHDDTAKQQLRVLKATQQLKMENPLRMSAAAYSAEDCDRLKSNKTGSPGSRSMGGIGRSHGKHRTRNVNTLDSGHFKLEHQKQMSQSFAADI